MPEDPSHDDRGIVVSIVNFGAAERVIAGLPALLAEIASYRNRAVIVVDNASPDGDGDRLERGIAALGAQEVRLVRSSRNGGFAAGNNLAFAEIRGLGWRPDAVMLLNPDAEVRPGAAAELFRVLDSAPGIGFVGARLENPDGSTWSPAFHFPTPMQEFARATGLGIFARVWPLLFPTGSRPFRVDWVAGAAILMSSDMLDAVGEMDEGFFLYFEEIEFMRRALGLGWQTWHAPAALVFHDAGTSTGLVDGRPKRGRMPAYWFDSWRRYFEIFYGRTGARLAALLRLAGMTIGGVQRRLRGRPSPDPDRFLLDFLESCLLRRSLRTY